MRIRKSPVLLVAAMMLLITASVAMAAKPVHPTIHRFELSGPAISDVMPKGKAIYHANVRNSWFRVQVRHVDLPGVVLDVFVDGSDVGDISLNEAGNGRLALRSRRGDTVPAVTETSVIEVRSQADGSVVLGN